MLDIIKFDIRYFERGLEVFPAYSERIDPECVFVDLNELHNTEDRLRRIADQAITTLMNRIKAQKLQDELSKYAKGTGLYITMEKDTENVETN